MDKFNVSSKFPFASVGALTLGNVADESSLIGAVLHQVEGKIATSLKDSLAAFVGALMLVHQ